MANICLLTYLFEYQVAFFKGGNVRLHLPFIILLQVFKTKQSSLGVGIRDGK